MTRLHRVLHHCNQVLAQLIQVDLIAQGGAESSNYKSANTKNVAIVSRKMMQEKKIGLSTGPSAWCIVVESVVMFAVPRTATNQNATKSAIQS